MIQVPLRTRVQPFKASNIWRPVAFEGDFSVAGSAILICDMWDKHWCSGASQRVADLARRIEPVLQKARSAGVLIIHSPSDTMGFYKDYPQRQFVLQAPPIKPPTELNITDPPLPIDDSDGGCDTAGGHEHQVWLRENAILSIGRDDAISDNGEGIYKLLQQRGIHTLFVMGGPYQHVRAEPEFCYPANDAVGDAVRASSRPDGCDVQPRATSVRLACRRNGVGDRAYRKVLVPIDSEPRSQHCFGQPSCEI